MEINNKKHLYKRPMTHPDYLGNSDVIRNSKGPDLLQHHITENKIKFKQEVLNRKDVFKFLNDKYIEQETASYVLPQMLGGISLLLFSVSFYFLEIKKVQPKKTNS